MSKPDFNPPPNRNPTAQEAMRHMTNDPYANTRYQSAKALIRDEIARKPRDRATHVIIMAGESVIKAYTLPEYGELTLVCHAGNVTFAHTKTSEKVM